MVKFEFFARFLVDHLFLSVLYTFYMFAVLVYYVINHIIMTNYELLIPMLADDLSLES